MEENAGITKVGSDSQRGERTRRSGFKTTNKPPVSTLQNYAQDREREQMLKTQDKKKGGRKEGRNRVGELLMGKINTEKWDE